MPERYIAVHISKRLSEAAKERSFTDSISVVHDNANLTIELKLNFNEGWKLAVTSGLELNN